MQHLQNQNLDIFPSSKPYYPQSINGAYIHLVAQLRNLYFSSLVPSNIKLTAPPQNILYSNETMQIEAPYIYGC